MALMFFGMSSLFLPLVCYPMSCRVPCENPSELMLWLSVCLYL